MKAWLLSHETLLDNSRSGHIRQEQKFRDTKKRKQTPNDDDDSRQKAATQLTDIVQRRIAVEMPMIQQPEIVLSEAELQVFEDYIAQNADLNDEDDL